ncbi:hypothetical protein DIE15_13330 [Burkholderia sp. Bp9031]|nr:hypothetical protein DIE15_13330 [Burkholderia sp. Bp9031]
MSRGSHVMERLPFSLLAFASCRAFGERDRRRAAASPLGVIARPSGVRASLMPPAAPRARPTARRVPPAPGKSAAAAA